ncbi:glycosyltransferase family 4 protein [Mucilaginibacter robiniae]|uniref:Glycosyltransferase family 4 protein n=1 Tax=Mucilaginibacter robiniae TaxID=2728022 RepID=A0A7L5E5C2_9SPHI|nr:glycosyltransferase [Mucilaginibacter robiniae]QJD96954.1 glycosyltransferase family 4 protein [Mucilaginibacter robiniae]
MRIIFFTHPPFLGSQSMPRFARMLAEGMQNRGHETEVWTPEAKFYLLPVPQMFKKWMGYIDQYLVFPAQVRKRMAQYGNNTLFVFTDQALGPWVPLVAKRPHVIHCHDFLAQQSALGQISENPTSRSGQQYQAYIRSGYQQGKNFISVSHKTQQDLHQFLGQIPPKSLMVYNGLNQKFIAGNTLSARKNLSAQLSLDLNNGYLLHVGGNQWYKNRTGVIEIYNEWRKTAAQSLPLLMIGAVPDAKLTTQYESSPYKEDIHLVSGKSDDVVKLAYQGAAVFLFPSLAEGFGWPIAEAMASGCPVITTGEAPMTEVGGEVAFYIPRRPQTGAEVQAWAQDAATQVSRILAFPAADREQQVAKGLINAARFNADGTLNRLEHIYQDILQAAL